MTEACHELAIHAVFRFSDVLTVVCCEYTGEEPLVGKRILFEAEKGAWTAAGLVVAERTKGSSQGRYERNLEIAELTSRDVDVLRDSTRSIVGRLQDAVMVDGGVEK